MKRAVITGLGALTPLGNNVEECWKNCKNGQSGAGPITRFDATNFKTRFACEIKGYNPDNYFDRKELRKMDPFCQYAMVAADEAIKDSDIDISKIDPTRAGVIWGSGYGGVLSVQEPVIDYGVHGRQPRFSPFFITRMIINMGAGLISIKYGFKGINYAPVAACATSNVAILESLNQIRWGKADIIIAGGSEAAIAEAGIGGFNGSMRARGTRGERRPLGHRGRASQARRRPRLTLSREGRDPSNSLTRRGFSASRVDTFSAAVLESPARLGEKDDDPRRSLPPRGTVRRTEETSGRRRAP